MTLQSGACPSLLLDPKSLCHRASKQGVMLPDLYNGRFHRWRAARHAHATSQHHHRAPSRGDIPTLPPTWRMAGSR